MVICGGGVGKWETKRHAEDLMIRQPWRFLKFLVSACFRHSHSSAVDIDAADANACITLTPKSRNRASHWSTGEPFLVFIESALLYNRSFVARNLYPENGLLRVGFYEIGIIKLMIRAPILDKLSILTSLLRGGVFWLSNLLTFCFFM